MLHYSGRTDWFAGLHFRTDISFFIRRKRRSDRIRCDAGKNHLSVLLSACLFPLHGRNPARCRPFHGSDAGHDDLLVPDPCQLHQHCGSFYPGDQCCVLGLPDHLDLKFYCIYGILFQIRLDTWIGKAEILCITGLLFRLITIKITKHNKI